MGKGEIICSICVGEREEFIIKKNIYICTTSQAFPVPLGKY